MTMGRWGGGGIRKRPNGGWAIRYSVNGRPYHESVADIVGKPPGKTTEADARRALKLRLGEIHGGRFVNPAHARMTVGELLDRYVENRRLEGVRTIEWIERMIPHLKQHVGAWRVRDVSLPLLQKWANERLAEGFAPATVKRDIAYVRSAFAVGRRLQIVTVMPDFPRIRVDNARQGFFAPEEFRAVRRYLPAPLDQVCTFGYWSGWRPREIKGLTWAEVDRTRRVVTLPAGRSKNKRPRVLPLVGELWDVIEARWRARVFGTTIVPYVFHRQGRPIRDFRRSWRTACRKAGVPGKLFYDFRRTMVRDQELAGVPRSVGKRNTGHVSDQVYSRYAIMTEGEQADALRKVEAYRERGQHVDTGATVTRIGR
jgi:integrase